MAILYKHFDRARIVFWTIFACFLLLSLPVQAQNDLFTIEGVEIDVTADNALKARDQAFFKAQQIAFSTLAQRMLSESELAIFQMPEASVVSMFVQDYEVTQEKLSNIRYIGTYTFRFKDDSVRRYFSGKGVTFTDVGSKPVLVLPYYQTEGRTVLWSPYNEWMQAWHRAENLGGLVPVTVPLGDLLDVRAIEGGESLRYDPGQLQEMLTRYSAGEAVLVVAIPDANLSLVSDGADPATGALTIYIYRTDRLNPEFVKQIVQTATTGQTKDFLFDEAVKKIHSTLQRDWKTRMVVTSAENSTLQVQVPFRTLGEWAETRKALEAVPGLHEIIIKSLSPGGARLEIVFQGTERRLRLALQQADMTLSSPRFSMAGLGQRHPETGSVLVYELYLNRYAPNSGRF